MYSTHYEKLEFRTIEDPGFSKKLLTSAVIGLATTTFDTLSAFLFVKFEISCLNLFVLIIKRRPLNPSFWITLRVHSSTAPMMMILFDSFVQLQLVQACVHLGTLFLFTDNFYFLPRIFSFAPDMCNLIYTLNT